MHLEQGFLRSLVYALSTDISNELMSRWTIQTFKIMLLPRSKYPAAVSLGHWWCIWMVSFWTCRSSLGDPSTVDTWQMVMKGIRDWTNKYVIFSLFLDSVMIIHYFDFLILKTVLMYLLKRVSDSRVTCHVSLTICILIVPRIWTVFKYFF